MKNLPKWLKTLLISLIVVVVVGGSFGLGFLTRSLSYEKEIDSINYILQMYKRYYYEESDDIVGVVADGLLDQYSEYFSKEDYELAQKSAQGGREGIGVSSYGNQLNYICGNSPAEKSGLQEGDIVTKLTYNEVDYPITNGNEWTTAFEVVEVYKDFTLQVLRGSESVNITLQKQEYTETYVRYYTSEKMFGFSDSSGSMSTVELGENKKYSGINQNTAVIELRAFNGLLGGLDGAVGQFDEMIKKFSQEGKTKLILDLRNNPGGFLDILNDIARHLINTTGFGKPTVVVKDKYENQSVYKCGNVDFQNYGIEKIVILANSGSASASEALMGCILDYDTTNMVKVILEGLVVNNQTIYRTYGKGIMQTTYTRITGEAIKLTTAKLFWPVSNVCIHGVGLNPEIDNRIVGESINGCVYDAINFTSDNPQLSY